MATKKTQPDEWTPDKQDEHTGLGGSYVYDPETGTRRPAAPDKTDITLPKPFMPEEEQTKAED